MWGRQAWKIYIGISQVAGRERSRADTINLGEMCDAMNVAASFVTLASWTNRAVIMRRSVDAHMRVPR